MIRLHPCHISSYPPEPVEIDFVFGIKLDSFFDQPFALRCRSFAAFWQADSALAVDHPVPRDAWLVGDRHRDAARLEMQIAGGLEAGRSLLRGNVQTPEPAPLVAPALVAPRPRAMDFEDFSPLDLAEDEPGPAVDGENRFPILPRPEQEQGEES